MQEARADSIFSLGKKYDRIKDSGIHLFRLSNAMKDLFSVIHSSVSIDYLDNKT
jgi:hypothetical protein